MKKRSKMVTLRFTSLVLASFFVFQVLRISSVAQAHCAHGGAYSVGARMMLERHHTAAEKEKIHDAVTKTKGFGGRKMNKGHDDEYAQVSASRKTKDRANQQPRTTKLNVSGKDHESKSAVAAEIETFMYRDYHGMRRPRRRSPINNRVPND